MNGVQNFDYTGKIIQATIKKAGYYKLEVWGAQGGGTNSSSDTRGGYGGYTYGNIYQSQNSVLYIVVGQQGNDNPQQCGVHSVSTYGGLYSGGFNGGGDYYYNKGATVSSGVINTGGGATHVATRSGILSSLSSYKTDVLIVAGGGGSGMNHRVGGSGGGYSGGRGTNNVASYGGSISNEGQQSVGGAVSSPNANPSYPPSSGSFGTGGKGSYRSVANCYDGVGGGGGGGYYGGGGNAYEGGGGGSGYLNTAKLSSNSYGMYCYAPNNNYSVDSDTDRYTGYCGTSSSYFSYGTTSTGHAVANRANTGNGYAKITYLGT